MALRPSIDELASDPVGSPRYEATAAPLVEHGPRVLLVGRDGSVRALEGDTAALVEVALELLRRPLTRAELAAGIAERAGQPPGPAIIDDLLALLRDAGAIRAAVTGSAPGPALATGARVLLGLTGAIGTLAAPALVAALQRRGCEVRVAATRASLRFASVAGLEAITHRRVVRSLWGRDPAAPVPHLELAAWADLLVISPASATTLARLASGDHGDVVAAAALATRVPVVLAPSMNPAMLEKPAVQRNLERLRADGFYVVPPGPGVEVADRPDDRVADTGGAPPPERMADLAVAILRASGWARPAPRAVDWERAHAERAGQPEELRVDDDVAAAVRAHAPLPGLLLDIGTGDGAFAQHAARAGYQVVATDVSATALSRARARAADLPITWLRDDITDSRLEGGFAVAVDRGCLHHLAPVEIPRWGHTVARLIAPGGLLVVKTDAKVSGEALLALLAPAFTLVEARATTFLTDGGPIAASLVVLRHGPAGEMP